MGSCARITQDTEGCAKILSNRMTACCSVLRVLTAAACMLATVGTHASTAGGERKYITLGEASANALLSAQRAKRTHRCPNTGGGGFTCADVGNREESPHLSDTYSTDHIGNLGYVPGNDYGYHGPCRHWNYNRAKCDNSYVRDSGRLYFCKYNVGGPGCSHGGMCDVYHDQLPLQCPSGPTSTSTATTTTTTGTNTSTTSTTITTTSATGTTTTSTTTRVYSEARFAAVGIFTYVVPAGVESVTFKVFGSGGVPGSHSFTDGRKGSLAGGQGGYVQGSTPVSPGDAFTLVVGGPGAGFGSTSRGGGLVAVFKQLTAATKIDPGEKNTTHLLLVAGSGGGGGDQDGFEEEVGGDGNVLSIVGSKGRCTAPGRGDAGSPAGGLASGCSPDQTFAGTPPYGGAGYCGGQATHCGGGGGSGYVSDLLANIVSFGAGSPGNTAGVVEIVALQRLKTTTSSTTTTTTTTATAVTATTATNVEDGAAVGADTSQTDNANSNGDGGGDDGEDENDDAADGKGNGKGDGDRQSSTATTAIKTEASNDLNRIAAAIAALNMSAQELLEGGFTPTQLIDAGYTKSDLVAAGLDEAVADAAVAANADADSAPPQPNIGDIPDADADATKDDKGIVIGGTLAGVAILLAIIGLAIYLRKNKEADNDSNADERARAAAAVTVQNRAFGIDNRNMQTTYGEAQSRAELDATSSRVRQAYGEVQTAETIDYATIDETGGGGKGNALEDPDYMQPDVNQPDVYDGISEA